MNFFRIIVIAFGALIFSALGVVMGMIFVRDRTVAQENGRTISADIEVQAEETAVAMVQATFTALAGQAAMHFPPEETSLPATPTTLLATPTAPPVTATPQVSAEVKLTAVEQASPVLLPQVQVRVSSANVRRGPGANYPVLLIALRDSVFPVLAVSADRRWYHISISEKEQGWIAASVVDVLGYWGDMVQVADAVSPPPTATPPLATSPTPTAPLPDSSLPSETPTTANVPPPTSPTAEEPSATPLFPPSATPPLFPPSATPSMPPPQPSLQPPATPTENISAAPTLTPPPPSTVNTSTPPPAPGLP